MVECGALVRNKEKEEWFAELNMTLISPEGGSSERHCL
jgi:hypothetical protein